MNRDNELALIQQCVNHAQQQTTTLSQAEAHSPVDRYTSTQQFDREMTSIFKRLPIAQLHSSELPAANSFKTVKTHLGNLVFTRDEDGAVHAFHNTCRHRGATLMNQESGCAKRLTCPYHAWSYNNKGELLIVPSERDCFPNLDKSNMGLKELACTEKYGFIWLCPQSSSNEAASQDLDQHLGDARGDIEWLDIEHLHIFNRQRRLWKCNWKIVNEGGLETYHFKFAHKNTIGPYFLNNSCVYDRLGDHMRVTMTTEAIKQAEHLPDDQKQVRDLAHIVYGFTPQTTFLVQKDHIDWIQMIPVSVDETEIVITSLIPKAIDKLTEQELNHWQRNQEISSVTLDEDFELAESIHSNMANGANATLTFGRNEGALKDFNDWVDRQCALID